VPDWIAIRSELGLSILPSEEELVNDDKVKGLISAEIKLNCYGIKKFEIPAAFAFLYERRRVGDLKGKDDLDAPMILNKKV
jgi:hypothetical protein